MCASLGFIAMNFHFNKTFFIIGAIIMFLLTFMYAILIDFSLEKQMYLWTYGGKQSIKKQIEELNNYINSSKPVSVEYFFKYGTDNVKLRIINYHDCVNKQHLDVLNKKRCGDKFISWFLSKELSHEALIKILEYHKEKLNYYNINY